MLHSKTESWELGKGKLHLPSDNLNKTWRIWGFMPSVVPPKRRETQPEEFICPKDWWRNARWQERRDAAEAPSRHATASGTKWMPTDGQQHIAEPCKGDNRKLQPGRRQESQKTTRKDWQHWCAKIKQKVVNNSDENPSDEGTELSRGQDEGTGNGCPAPQNVRLWQGNSQEKMECSKRETEKPEEIPNSI